MMALFQRLTVCLMVAQVNTMYQLHIGIHTMTPCFTWSKEQQNQVLFNSLTRNSQQKCAVRPYNTEIQCVCGHSICIWFLYKFLGKIHMNLYQHLVNLLIYLIACTSLVPEKKCFQCIRRSVSVFDQKSGQGTHISFIYNHRHVIVIDLQLFYLSIMITQ